MASWSASIGAVTTSQGPVALAGRGAAMAMVTP